MNVPGPLKKLPLLLVAGLAFAAVSCSSKTTGNGASIQKVNHFHLDSVNRVRPVADPSISFERDYRMHGAITNVERQDRLGNYINVFWKVKDRSQPVTVRLEYRQKNTGTQIKVLEQVVNEPTRYNSTEFAFTGSEYTNNGSISSWRASLWRNGQELVSYASFLWE